MAPKAAKRRPPAREATVQVGMRLPLSVVERVDRYVERIRRETGLMGLTRTDAAIALLVRGLETTERERRR